MIDAFDDVGFESVAEKCTKLLKGKLISLVTDSQHLHQMDKVEKIWRKNGWKVEDVSMIKGGCDFKFSKGSEVVYCEVKGTGVSADAYHLTAPHPEGDGAYRVMRKTINQAKINCTEVDYINVIILKKYMLMEVVDYLIGIMSVSYTHLTLPTNREV